MRVCKRFSVLGANPGSRSACRPAARGGCGGARGKYGTHSGQDWISSSAQRQTRRGSAGKVRWAAHWLIVHVQVELTRSCGGQGGGDSCICPTPLRARASCCMGHRVKATRWGGSLVLTTHSPTCTRGAARAPLALQPWRPPPFVAPPPPAWPGIVGDTVGRPGQFQTTVTSRVFTCRCQRHRLQLPCPASEAPVVSYMHHDTCLCRRYTRNPAVYTLVGRMIH